MQRWLQKLSAKKDCCMCQQQYFHRMETIEQSPFLTTVSHFPGSSGAKQSVHSIKQSIKQLLARMAQKQVLHKIIKNMGIGVQVYYSFDKVLKEKQGSVKKLMAIQKQLKAIHVEYEKLAYSCRLAKGNGINRQDPEIEKKFLGNGELDRQRKCSEENSFLLTNQMRVMKAQIERQIFERKCVNQIRYRSRSQKKNQLMKQRMNNAKQMNSRCQQIHRSEKQKERLKNEEIINHRRLLSSENQGWRIRQAKNIQVPSGSPKAQTTQRFHYKRFTPVDHFRPIDPIQGSFGGKDGCRQETASVKIIANNTARLGGSECRYERYQNVLKRKCETEAQQEQQMINKAMKKSMRIALVARQKCLKTETAETWKGQKQNREGLKKSNTLMYSRSQSGFEWFQQEEKLREKQNQKIQRKEQLKYMKSELVRERALRSRDRFLRKKFEVDALTKIKVEKAVQGEREFRCKLQLKRQSESKRIEQVIRKKRQQCEFKQTLSEEISNLKKYSDRQLQKKLEEINRNCTEREQNEGQETIVAF